MRVRFTALVLVVLVLGCEKKPPQVPEAKTRAEVRNPVEEIGRALLEGSAGAKMKALSAILSLDPATRREHKKTLQGLLRHCLSDEDPDLRKEAALVFLKMEGGLELLVESLDLVPEEDEEVMGVALGAVEELLGSTDTKPRLKAMDLLLEIGKPAVGILFRTLGDPDADVRLGALDALWSIGPAQAGFAERVSALLKDPDPRVRQAAAAAVDRLRGNREEQAEPEQKVVPKLPRRK